MRYIVKSYSQAVAYVRERLADTDRKTPVPTLPFTQIRINTKRIRPMKFIPLTVSLLLCLSARLFSQSTVTEQILRIDPGNAFGSTAGKMLADVEYIPLESSKASLFNKIDQLAVTSQYFIVLDRRGNTILIFDRTGKFVRKLLPPGESPNEFEPAFYSFSVDHSRQEIVATSGIRALAPYFLVYDMNGKLLRKKKKQAKNADETISMGDGWLLSNINTPEARGSTGPQLVIESEDQVEETLLPYDPQSVLKGNDRLLQGKFLYNSGNGNFFFRNYYSYQLVELNRQGLQKKYRIVLPASYSLPQNFLTDTAMEGKRMEYAVHNPGKVFCFSNIYRASDKLVFRLAIYDTQFRDRTLMYDLKTGQTFTLNGLRPDSTNAYLPFFDIIGEVQACDGQHFFTCLPAYELYQSHEQHTAKSPVYPPQIAAFLEKKDRMANAVIVRFRFKSEL